MEDEKSTPSPRGYTHAPRAYALSGKIILSALVVLLAVVFLIFCLHVYVRCFLLRRRRNQLRRDASRRQRQRQSRLVVVGQNSSITELAHFGGLDASTLRSLPLFVFSTKSHPSSEEEQMECAVCLSEFQEGEMGKFLPKCNHSFHIDCIDMWFLTHSTCPLCRAAVQSQGPPQQHVSASAAVVSVEPETGADGSSSSRLCTSCRMDEETCPSNSSSSSSSLSSSFSSASSESIPQESTSSFRKKALGCAEIRIEVPSRVETLEGESSSGSPGGQGLKSPGSRMLSLKRILSWERRFSPKAIPQLSS